MEDKFIFFQISFDNIQTLMRSGNLSRVRSLFLPLEREFDSNFIPDRSKILVYFTESFHYKLELIGNETNLDTYRLDFGLINDNKGYFNQAYKKFGNFTGHVDLITKIIRDKEYSDELNYMLVKISKTDKTKDENIRLLEFDYYYDSKLTVSKYENSNRSNAVFKFLFSKTLFFNKPIKFATVLQFKEEKLPYKTADEDKIYLLEVNKNFKIHFTSIDAYSLDIDKTHTFNLDEFFGCPLEKENKK